MSMAQQPKYNKDKQKALDNSLKDDCKTRYKGTTSSSDEPCCE